VQETSAEKIVRRLPHRVTVLGAAGALGQGILGVCKADGVQFTAIVRSRPNRIAEVPSGCRVAVVTSLADRPALTEAFAGADAVLTAIGLTSTSAARSALLSANMATIEESMLAAGVDQHAARVSSGRPREPGIALLLTGTRRDGSRGFRTASRRRCSRKRRVFFAALDTRPGWTQLTGKE